MLLFIMLGGLEILVICALIGLIRGFFIGKKNSEIG
jgi:hypothetical protein